MARYDKKTNTFAYNDYYVDENGEIKSREIFSERYDKRGKTSMQENLNAFGLNEQISYSRAIQESLSKKQNQLRDSYEKTLADVTSRENTYNTLAQQIAALTAGGGMRTGAAFNAAVQGLNAGRNYGTSDLCVSSPIIKPSRVVLEGQCASF